LLFTDQNGIVGTLNGNTLLLVGSASLANYQSALRSVRYANSADSPDTSTRTITFRVTDADDGVSNETYRNIEFTAENTPPVITEGTSVSVTMDEDADLTAFSLTLNATDADYHSISWSISSAASHGTALTSGNGDSKEISYVPTADYYGSDSFVVQISDGNGGTDIITVNVTITDRTPPIISAVASGSLTTSSALITWTTDENTSTKVSYGLSTSYGSNTSETDTSSRVISHSKTVSGLQACTTYYFAVVSTDATSNTSTTAGGSFTTSGCAGDATIRVSTGSNVIHNVNGSTGSIMLSDNSLSLTVPIGYIATNVTCSTGAYFQIKALTSAPVKTELGSPSGRDTIINAYNLSAYCPDLTPVTEFDESLTIVFTYSDADVSGLVESSLGTYRFGSGSTVWEELTCNQDTSANTLTCSTVAFSSFGIFGTPVSTASDTSNTTGTQSAGGRRGSATGMGERIAAAKSAILARYQGDRLQEVAVVEEPQHAAAEKEPAVSLSSEERRIHRATQKSMAVFAPRPIATIAQQRGRLYAFIQETPILYRDVPIDAWFTPYVAMLIEENIAQGYKDEAGKPTGEFGVVSPITYAEVLKMALESAGYDVAGLPPPRNISARGSWANAYVAKAEELGLTVFSLERDVHTAATRGEVIQTILEVLKLPIAKQSAQFSDVPRSHPYANVIATAAFFGFITGDTDSEGNELNTFRPDDPINRAEVAKIIALVKEAME
ncbi:MAG: S-layer homology domain-containing protein, partial [Candidatus Peribacteraceae bacterium]